MAITSTCFLRKSALIPLALLLFAGCARAQNPELVVQIGHSSNIIVDIDFSPDGRILATAGLEDDIKLWDVSTGTLLRTIECPTEYTVSLDFSPDGRSVASGAENNTVRIWDVRTGRPVDTLAGHSGFVTDVAYSPDGRMLASGSNDATVKLWDVATGTLVRTLTGNADDSGILSVRFSPDGKTLAASGTNEMGGHTNIPNGIGMTRLWEVATGRELHFLFTSSDAEFSPDGGTIASGRQVWDVASGEALPAKPKHGIDGEGTASAISPDWTISALGNAEGEILLFDESTGGELQKLVGHREIVERIRISPDGTTVASVSADGKITLWDIHSGRTMHTIGGQ